MSKIIKKVSKFRTLMVILAMILTLPLVSSWFINLLSHIPILKNLTVYFNLIPASIIYAIIDSGKYGYFGYIFLSVIISTILLFKFISSKKLGIFRYLPFYYFLAVVIQLIFITGWLLSHMGKYYPALKPKEGVKYQVIDYPRKGLDNWYRKILIYTEGSDDKYEIIGWKNNEVLVYQKTPGSRLIYGQSKLWEYNTITKGSVEFKGDINRVDQKTCKYKDCIEKYIETFYSLSGPCINAYASLENDKVACLTRYTYGPEDIIIFEE